MNSVIKTLLGLLALLVCSQNTNAALDCQGQFPNLITDICWTCAFPINFGSGGLTLPLSIGQEGTPDPGGLPVCVCGANVGVKITIYQTGYYIHLV